MLESSHRYFHRAADLFGLDPNLRSILLTPNRFVKAELAFEGADREDPSPRGFVCKRGLCRFLR